MTLMMLIIRDIRAIRWPKGNPAHHVRLVIKTK